MLISKPFESRAFEVQRLDVAIEVGVLGHNRVVLLRGPIEPVFEDLDFLGDQVFGLLHGIDSAHRALLIEDLLRKLCNRFLDFVELSLLFPYFVLVNGDGFLAAKVLLLG